MTNNVSDSSYVPGKTNLSDTTAGRVISQLFDDDNDSFGYKNDKIRDKNNGFGYKNKTY